ncbi:MAG TPA: BMC domain-containing protein, partial [Candidatus Sumerlaeota bacterium]|nr:BMC domain-containing protein [Candidatus Sumerlaeota bacterium]
MPLNAIGLVEVSSIAIGHLAEDAMLKTASVDLL